MAYSYRATTRLRFTGRHWRHGQVEVSADEGDTLDYDDPATRWAIDEHLLPSGAVERKRGTTDADKSDESEED